MTQIAFNKKLFIVFAVSVLWLPERAHATDPLRFLQDSTQIQVQLDAEGNPKLFADDGDAITYWAVDAFDNSYKLTIQSPPSLVAELTASFLAEALGLPALTLYPILVQRGAKGIPNPYNENAPWVAATVQPTSELMVAPIGSLNPKQKLSYLKKLIFRFVTGKPPHSSGDTVSLNGNHVVWSNFSQSFSFSDPFHSLSLSSVFDLNRRELRLIRGELRQFISRIEAITQSQQLASTLGPYFEQVNLWRASQGMTTVDIFAAMSRRIERVRHEFTAQMESRLRVAWISAVMDNLLGPNQPALPVISLPRQRITSDHIFDLTEKYLSEELWAYYFQPDPNLRSQALEQWRPSLIKLGLSTENPIASIQNFIAQSPAAKNYYIGPALQFAEPLEVPQVTLNPVNSATMVIVPLNDTEAHAVADLVESSGALLFTLRATHGVKLEELTPEGIQEIKQLVQENAIKRIVTMEIPESTPGYERQLQAEIGVRDFIIVDHHAYRGLNRGHRHSSLEQVASILGAKLNPRETIIGVNDRSFVYGLIELGVPKEEFLKMEDHSAKQVTIKNQPLSREILQTIETPYGPLAISYDQEFDDYRIGEIAFTLAKKDFQIVSLLIIGPNDMRYSGIPELIPHLTKVGTAWEGSTQAHYSGGDRNLSMFWGLKGIAPQDILQVQSEILTELTQAPDHHGTPALNALEFFIENALADITWSAESHLLESLVDMPQAKAILTEHILPLPHWQQNSRLTELLGGKPVILENLIKALGHDQECATL